MQVALGTEPDQFVDPTKSAKTSGKSGGTGQAVDPAHLAVVREAAGGRPVLVASGASVEALPALKDLCDGVIVGSALRADGRAGGPIDAAAARGFAAAFRAAFGPARA